MEGMCLENITGSFPKMVSSSEDGAPARSLRANGPNIRELLTQSLQRPPRRRLQGHPVSSVPSSLTPEAAFHSSESETLLSLAEPEQEG